MKISQKGINLIKEFSIPSFKSYADAFGVIKIGYNHTTDLAVGTRITEQIAEELLYADLSDIEQGVSRLVRRKLSQHQFDALVSFVFSSGDGDFLKSTLLKKIKANPNDATISIEFSKWIHENGKPLGGLRRRRKAEAELYFTKEQDEEL